MDIELGKLACDTGLLLKLARAFQAANVGAIRLESKGGKLSLYGSNNRRRFSDGFNTDWMYVSVPYGGIPDSCFSEVDNLIEDIHKAQEILRVRTRAMPLGWDTDNLMLLKSSDAQLANADATKEAMEFLLCLDPLDQPLEFRGVIYDEDKIMITDGVSVHVTAGHPTVVPEPRMMGLDAAYGLHSLIKVLKPLQTTVKYAKSRCCLGYGLINETVEAFISSKVRFAAQGLMEFCPTITQSSIGFSAAKELLLNVLQATLNQAEEDSELVVYLEAGDTLKYTTMVVEEEGEIHTVYQGDLPMVRTMGVDNVGVSLDLRALMSALLAQGDSAQFLVPCHPKFGFKYYSIDPVMVNCSADKFAVVQQYTLNEEYAYDLIEKRREEMENAT